MKLRGGALLRRRVTALPELHWPPWEDWARVGLSVAPARRPRPLRGGDVTPDRTQHSPDNPCHSTLKEFLLQLHLPRTTSAALACAAAEASTRRLPQAQGWCRLPCSSLKCLGAAFQAFSITRVTGKKKTGLMSTYR